MSMEAFQADVSALEQRINTKSWGHPDDKPGFRAYTNQEMSSKMFIATLKAVMSVDDAMSANGISTTLFLVHLQVEEWAAVWLLLYNLTDAPKGMIALMARDLLETLRAE